MNVGPCASTGTCPREIPSATTGVHSVAAIVRYPPVSALPTQNTSGTTPAWSAPNSAPVRPNPVAISSKTSSTSFASVTSRSARRYPGLWKRIPPAPCTTGSTTTAASSSACSSTCRTSSST